MKLKPSCGLRGRTCVCLCVCNMIGNKIANNMNGVVWWRFDVWHAYSVVDCRCEAVCETIIMRIVFSPLVNVTERAAGDDTHPSNVVSASRVVQLSANTFAVQRCRTSLLFEHYTYAVERIRARRTYYRCAESRLLGCRARLVVVLTDTDNWKEYTRFKEHNHPAKGELDWGPDKTVMR